MRILVVDDEERFAALLARLLAAEGLGAVAVAHSAEQALAAPDPDLLITDLRLPGASGIELMRALRARVPALPCILMTAFADVATARSALTSGAADYLVKPFDNAELVALVRRLGVPAGPDDRCGELIGASAAMRRTFTELRRAAAGDASVLLLGESGTGKELAARALHALSARSGRRLVEANLAALPESTLASEIFGHERGAFTGAERRRAELFESADRGTLFLDEIGELPLHLQPQLLRVLQERRFQRLGGSEEVAVDVRLVAATNRDLRAEVAAGRFRADLFYRLDVLTITLPPLRTREDDVLLLANHLLGARRPGAQLTAAAAAALRAHPWPGNVRELANAIERALVVAEGGRIDVVHLPDHLRPAVAAQAPGPVPLDHQEHERQLILSALQRAQGSKTRAAELLGITRRRLYSRLERLGIDPGPEPG